MTFLLPPSNGNMVGLFRRVHGGQVTTCRAGHGGPGGALARPSQQDVRQHAPRSARRRRLARGIWCPQSERDPFREASVTRTRRFGMFAGSSRPHVTRVSVHWRQCLCASPGQTGGAGHSGQQATSGTHAPPPGSRGWEGQGLSGTSEEAWLAPLPGAWAASIEGHAMGGSPLRAHGPGGGRRLVAPRIKHFAPISRAGSRRKDRRFPLVRTAPGRLFLSG
jgi:hypothetical protein